jgi:hypothetical protein
VKVNALRDWAERVGWTFVEAYLALGALDWIANGVNLSLLHQLYGSLGAALVATVKVLLAQRVGTRGSGDAIPGGVLEPASPPPAPPG